MIRKELEIDSRVNDLVLIARKAEVIAEDLGQDYFGEDSIDASNVWRLMGQYYDAAELKTGIVNDYLHDVVNGLAELQKLVNADDED